VLNELRKFIPATFKSNVTKNVLHELGHPRYTKSMYCGRYIRITSETIQVCLRQHDWSQLMGLIMCLYRQTRDQVRKTQDEMVERRDKCAQSVLYTSDHKYH
jgi:hypothetical protein